jgi:glycosyltransferase involved in cell wall biosynthesis
MPATLRSPLRLLAVQAAKGYSPEASVFATLLGERRPGLEALVLLHQAPGEVAAERFASVAKVRPVEFDMGFRLNEGGRRTLAQKAGSWARMLAVMPALLERARAFDPQVVYSSQQQWDVTIATALARLLGRPQVIHLHYRVGPWLRRIPLYALGRCDRIVAVSDFIARDASAAGLDARKIVRIHNAIRPAPPDAVAVERVRAGLGLRPGDPVAGIVARLDPEKGHADALAAFAAVAGQVPRARLVIVGEGQQRAALEAAVPQALRDRVTFTGWRDDIPALLACLSVFIHPSRGEPFSLAILEASAAGLPVLAYDEGGPAEIVQNGRTGVLVPAGELKALGAALEHLLTDADTAKRMGEAGIVHVTASFRPEVAAARFEEVLAEVVAERAAR